MRQTVLILNLLFLTSVASAEAVIRVLPKVEVDAKETITLGDITQFEDLDLSEKQIKKLQSVHLADAPKPGESRLFTDIGLAQVLRTHIRAIEQKTGEKITLHMPAKVTVIRKPLRLEESAVAAELKKQMNALCLDCEFEISQLILPVLNQSIPSGSRWALKMRPELPKGSFSIPLEIKNEDSTRRLFWITGQVIVRKRVPVAKRLIAIGEKIQSNDISHELKDITFSVDQAADNVEIEASYASREIAANQVVWRSYLRRETATRQGELVRVIAGSESWQISVEGVAQQSGYVGDLIRVKIPRTQKTVSGLIREKGVVEVR